MPTAAPRSDPARAALGARLLTASFFTGSVAIFVGERILAVGPARFVASGIGAALLVASLVLRALVAFRGPATYRPAARRLAATHLGAVVAVGLYALSTDGGLALIGFKVPLAQAGQRLRVVLQCLYPIVWLASAVPLVLLHRAARPLGTAGEMEERRVSEAALAGLGLAFAMAFLFTVNWLATQHDQSVDLGYFRIARPGPGVKDLVGRIEEPIEVILFFPEANEVADKVEGYFKALASSQPNLTVSRKDRFLEPDLAKKFKITADGVVLVRKGEVGEQWSVGTDPSSARYKLKKLDSDFQERMTRLARSSRVAYLTAGHGELGEGPSAGPEGGEAPRASLIRALLRRLGFEVKNLGLSEGLATDVPADATVVIVLGPKTAFVPEEIASLERYLDRGGRALIALDPGRSGGLAPLLGDLGLVYRETVLASDRYFLKRRYNDSDRQILFTASYSSHPSVANLSKSGGRAPIVMSGTGSLDRATDTRGAKIDFTVRTMGETWADSDGDFQYTPGPGGEEKKVFQVTAAVERDAVENAQEPVAAGAAGGKATAAGGGDAKRKTRAIVLADADMVGDDLLPAVGNQILVGDGIEWLAGVEGAKTEVASEEDVPIEHSRDQDRYWFYGTVFGVPLAVLGLGLGIVRLKRRKRT